MSPQARVTSCHSQMPPRPLENLECSPGPRQTSVQVRRGSVGSGGQASPLQPQPPSPPGVIPRTGVLWTPTRPGSPGRCRQRQAGGHPVHPLPGAAGLGRGEICGRPAMQPPLGSGLPHPSPASACRCGSFRDSSYSPSWRNGVSRQAGAPSCPEPGPLTAGTLSTAPPSRGLLQPHAPSTVPPGLLASRLPGTRGGGRGDTRSRLSLGSHGSPCGLCAETVPPAYPSVPSSSQGPFP